MNVLQSTAISSTSTATLLDGRSPALDTTSVAQVASAPLAISVQHPEDSPELQAALKSLGLQAKLAGDLQGVASALQPVLQTVIEQRPDLALASFDFHADQGGITVTSASLDDDDKAWLQQTFNASPGLVQAVQTFHDDAVAAWRSWAEADGQSASEISGPELSSRADQHFNFMDMFNQASQAQSRNMEPAGQYTSTSGAAVDFRATVDSSLSFLIFQKSNQAVLDGAVSYSTSQGRTYQGALRGNLFSIPQALSSFLPTSRSGSLGLDTLV